MTVASHRTRRKAIVIDIVDHGIGMTDEEVAKANEQLSHAAGVEGRISRRMGLFVISRLANQHGVRVRLHGGQDIPGLRVTITVPVELVISEPEPLPAQLPADGGSAPLPKRTAGASTGPNGQWQAALRGTLDTPAADLSDGPVTVTIPKVPSVASSGVGLFDPVVDGEAPTETPAGGGEAARADVTTDLRHDGVRVVRGRRRTRAGRRCRRWTFAADEGWQAVDAAVTVQPEEYTAAGLPKRQPKARLLPGSARYERCPTAGGAPPADRPCADPVVGFPGGIAAWRVVARVRTRDRKGRRTIAGSGRRHGSDVRAGLDVVRPDDGWRAADEVAEAAPGHGDSRRAARRRRPKAHLLPGQCRAPAGRTRPAQHGMPAPPRGPAEQLPTRRAPGAGRPRGRRSRARRARIPLVELGERMMSSQSPQGRFGWLVTDFTERVPGWRTRSWCPRTGCC